MTGFFLDDDLESDFKAFAKTGSKKGSVMVFKCDFKDGVIGCEKYSDPVVDGEKQSYKEQFEQITGSFKRYATRFFAARVAYSKDGRDIEQIVYVLRRAEMPSDGAKGFKKWKKIVGRDRMIVAMNGKNLIKEKFNLQMGCDYDGDDFDTADYDKICDNLRKKI